MECCVDRPLVVMLQKKPSVQDLHYLYRSDFDKSQPIFTLKACMCDYALDRLVANLKFDAKTQELFFFPFKRTEELQSANSL